MCECGCGEIIPEAVYKLGSAYVVVNRYPGCQNCCESPSVDVLFFNEAGYREFAQGVPALGVLPDAYGGKDRDGVDLRGRCEFAMPTVKDLSMAARELATDGDSEPFEEYEDLAHYLEDNGLRLMQIAMRISRAKEREQ